MGRITSSIGLVTGVPIEETVNQLMALNARPRDLIAARNAALQEEQLAINTLLTNVVGVQLAVRNLNDASLFEQRKVKSSNTDLLTAVKNGSPPPGDYQFTPVREAQSHQLLSSGFATTDGAIGVGQFRFSVGGFVDQAVDLSTLNGDRGVQRGSIRITDRSGSTATIDLKYARTVDDVLDAINAADDINVIAETNGDRIRLIDQTGATTSNLIVSEVGLGNTAADLGLSGIDTADSTVDGADIVHLTENTLLSELNNGAGLSLRNGLADLQFAFRDGSTLQVDFGDFSRDAGRATTTTTAANGDNAAITLTAKSNGASLDGVTLLFTSSGNVSQGSETVTYDADQKTITVDIASGASTANDVVAALTASSDVTDDFSVAAGGDGTGIVTTDDSGTTAGGAEIVAPEKPTLGDLLRVLNAADPNRLAAAISANGDSLEITDLTSGGGSFTVSSPFSGSAAEDLGLAQSTTSDSLHSQRLLSGLKTSLISSLNGGQGLGTLGALQITDRAGNSATIDLSTAETLDDVIRAINDSSLSIKAAVNRARNGLRITDTSGGSGSLAIADADATQTATLLGLAQTTDDSSISSGSLSLQTVSEDTLLSAYRGGISEGSFTVTNRSGQTGAISFRQLQPKTLGDLIDGINALGINVEAQINENGDGISLVDRSTGSGRLSLKNTGNSTVVDELGLAGASVTQTINGQSVEVLVSSSTYTIDISASDTLNDVVQKINDLDANVSATIFNEGFGSTPFRLSLASTISGSAGELLVDTSDVNFALDETAAAQDALLLVGGAGSGVLATSSTNSFDGVLTDVEVTIINSSTDSVTVSVDETHDRLKTNLNLFVDQYNSLVDQLDDLTFFNADTNETGLLFGSSVTLRVESGISRSITDRFRLDGKVESLAQLGISVDEEGKLSLDEDRLSQVLATDPNSVEEFFTSDNGFAKKFDDTLERLAGIDDSVLVARSTALQSRIELNNRRIDDLTIRLASQRERLLLQFYRMEQAIGRLQNNLTSIQSIQRIPPIASSSSN